MAETRRTETKDGSIIYSWMGKMHCWEGPAYIPQGNKRAAEYWLFGFKYTKDQWEDRKKDINGVPFYKTAAAKATGARVQAKLTLYIHCMEERRGRPAIIVQEEPLRKYTRVFEDEYAVETWTYNLDKFRNGPILVEIKYKAGAEKAMKQNAKQVKQEKKTARQMKKINSK